jgi:hypothetical protein
VQSTCGIAPSISDMVIKQLHTKKLSRVILLVLLSQTFQILY